MRIDIFSLQKSHSFAAAARFPAKTVRNVSSRVITSLDDISVSAIDSIDDVGILCVGSNLQKVIADIRSARITAPAIAMPDQKNAEAAIHLLNEGYDDVVNTDCGLEEIAARFRAIIRRSMAKDSNKLTHGRLVTYLDGGDPEVDGIRVKLTRIEYTILDAIARRSGQIIPREKLFERIWTDNGKHPYDKVLDVHIFNLRKKLKEASGGITFIETLPQRGYRLNPEAT